MRDFVRAGDGDGAVGPAHALTRRPQRLKGRAHRLPIRPPFLRQHNAAAVSREKRRAQLALQLLEMAAHGGLRRAKIGGRARDAAEPGDAVERLERAERGKSARAWSHSPTEPQPSGRRNVP